MCKSLSVLRQCAGSEVCVVHLIRKCNGIEVFQNFLESYRRHPAGHEHDLLLLFKGFDGDSDCASYESLAKDIPHCSLIVSDIGFDLYAYFLAAQALQNNYLCFLNSFSLIISDDWLAKLWGAMQIEGVGLVGASGSWGSIYPGEQNQKKFKHIKALIYYLYRRIASLYLGYHFGPFPNYHIRTNGFLINRLLLLTTKRGSLRTKMSVYCFESGKCSLTRQVMARGFGVRVVDCDGVAYAETEWSRSDTFWQGSQSRLLISDNQTRNYANAEVDEKLRLALFAWGHEVVDSQME